MDQRAVFGLCVVLIGLAVSPPFAGTAGQVLSRRWRTAGVMALMALMALGKKLRAFPRISNEFLNLFGYMSHEQKNPGWLGKTRGLCYPNIVGIITNHCKDPY